MRIAATAAPRQRPFRGDDGLDDGATPISPSLIRQRVFRRDQGVCAHCGVDTAVLGAVLQAEWQRVKNARTLAEQHERAAFRRRFRWFFRRQSYWDTHHVVPIAEGGASTLANIVTLCVPCHHRVTKEQARHRASRRRRQRGDRWSAWR